MDIKFYPVASLEAILRLIRDELRGFKSPWQDRDQSIRFPRFLDGDC